MIMLQSDREQPDFRLIVVAQHMNMGWLKAI
jgi:hypothetical protein